MSKVYEFLARVDGRLHRISTKYLRPRYLYPKSAFPPTVSERVIEYAFVMKNLDLVKPGKILDVGCTESVNCLPTILASLGFRVYGIDIREFKVKYRNFRFFKEDIRSTSFPDNYFDGIIAVSTLEHIGISGRYSAEEDPEGDEKAVKEMVRILKPGGKLIITVPYGRKVIVRPFHRVYDRRTLKDLFHDLRVDREEYYIRDKRGTLVPTYEKIAKKLSEPRYNYSIALFSLTKKSR